MCGGSEAVLQLPGWGWSCRTWRLCALKLLLGVHWVRGSSPFSAQIPAVLGHFLTRAWLQQPRSVFSQRSPRSLHRSFCLAGAPSPGESWPPGLPRHHVSVQLAARAVSALTNVVSVLLCFFFSPVSAAWGLSLPATIWLDRCQVFFRVIHAQRWDLEISEWVYGNSCGSAALPEWQQRDKPRGKLKPLGFFNPQSGGTV